MSSVLFPAMCFGKLPSHGDFVRHNAASREVLAFDEWIHQGMYFSKTQCGTQWDQTFASSPRYRFLYSPENADRCLVGFMQPSHDKSLRRYPFLVSLLVDRRRFNGGIHLLPLSLAHFLDEGSRLVERAMNGMESREIAEQTHALSVSELDPASPDASYRGEFLDTTTQEQFWTSLFDSFTDPRKFLVMKNLGDTLQPFKHRGLHRLTLGFRFPLSNDSRSSGFEVGFWLQLCQAMLGSFPGTPILFWNAPQNGTRGYLFVFFRPPSPKAYLKLLRPEVENEAVCVVDEEGKEKNTNVAQALPNDVRTLLDTAAMPLSRFLQEFSRSTGFH